LFTYAPHSYPQGTIFVIIIIIRFNTPSRQQQEHKIQIKYTIQNNYLADIVTPIAPSLFSWTASVRQQFPLRATTDETQIRLALFLICCTNHLEQSAAITATTN